MATTSERERTDRERKKVYTAEVIRQPGAQIALPDSIPLANIIEILQRTLRAEEEMVDLHETIDAFPYDAALAVWKAMEQMFGYANQTTGWKETGGFFPEKIKRHMINVIIDAKGTTVGVPWGRFEVPGLEGTVDTEMALSDDGRIILRVDAEVKGKYKETFHKMISLAKDIVARESIYRGKALDIKFTDERGEMNRLPPVKFVDVSNAQSPIFSDVLTDAMENDVLAFVRYAKEIRSQRGSTKRGVLLAGPFGTGKTMMAAWIAHEGTLHGYTFIYTKPADLPRAIDFATQYAPAIIFAEDLDASAVSERTDYVHQLLNKLDGIDTKGVDILCVFTTNFGDKVNPAMLRPGRIDAILPVEPPDAVAALRIAERYSQGNLDPQDDFTEAGVQLAGMIPAVISEAVSRARIRALTRTGDANALIRATELTNAALAVKAERGLFTHTPPKKDVELLGEAIGTAMGEPISRVLSMLPGGTPVEAGNGHGQTAKARA